MPHASVEVEIVLPVPCRVSRLRVSYDGDKPDRARGKAQTHQEN
ncbi:MAG: hypothetical protein WBV46_03715 [Terriglobales bacterium]